MTLVVVPVLYTYMDTLGKWGARFFARPGVGEVAAAPVMLAKGD